MDLQEPQIGIEPMTASLSETAPSAEVVDYPHATPPVPNPQGDRTCGYSALETVPEASPADLRSWQRAQPEQVMNRCEHIVKSWGADVADGTAMLVGYCVACEHIVTVTVPTPLDRQLFPPSLRGAWPVLRESVEMFYRRPRNPSPVTTLLSERALIDFRCSLDRQAREEAIQATAGELRRLTHLIEEHKDTVAALEQRIRRLQERYSESHGQEVLATSDDPAAYVYGLVASDRPAAVRYVGSTHTPAKRLRQHTGPKAHPKVRAWVEQVTRRGASVVMRCLRATTTRREAYQIEAETITSYAAQGWADLNTAGVST